MARMMGGPSTISSTGERGFSVQPAACSAGITLIELLVVLAIIGMIVGMSVPALSVYAKQMRLKTATREVVGLISLARSLAISSHEDHAVVIDPERRTIGIVNLKSGETLEQIVRLPSAVSVGIEVGGQSSSDMRLVFHPTGSLNGRTTAFVLADREKHHTITVMGTTGTVSVN